MHKAFAFCLLIAATLANIAQKDQDGFYALNADNYTNFLKENRRSFVLFYENNTPATEAALRIIPEAAAQLADQHPELKLAKINKESNAEFIKSLGNVGGYPHLRLYTNQDLYAIYIDYIEKAHIYGFLKVRLEHTPVINKIDQDENYAKFKNEDLAIYMSSPEIDETQTKFALDVQTSFPHIPVYIGITNSPIDKIVIPDSKFKYRFFLKRTFDEGDKMMSGDSPINPTGLVMLVHTYMEARVPKLSQSHIQRLFRFRAPAMIMFDNDLQSPAVKNFGEATKDLNFQGMLLKSTIKDPNAYLLADLLGVKESDLPTLRIMNFGVTRMHRYRLDNAVTLSDIKTFIDGYIQKQVDEYFREEEPQDLTGKGLKKLVRSNVEEVTSNQDRDTVVLFVSEKSPNSKQIIKAFDEAAEDLQNVTDLMLARVNLDKNDFSHLNLSQLPLVHIFKRGKAVEPAAKYTGEQESAALIKFIGEKLKRKIEPRKVTDEL